MTTKEKVLRLLENNNEYISGERLAKELNVTRASIWKTIKALQNDGYLIKAVTNKGYVLENNQDHLSYEGIQKYLHTQCDLEYQDSVTSTNTLTVQKALEGKEEGYVLVAGHQTNGKGRTGHTFYSPTHTGIYLSILLRPTTLKPEQATNITSMAAVAAVEAIEKISDVKPKIKWINDIFVDHKKVSGILTEASISMESGCMDYVVMGIGLNVYPPVGGFPEDIKTIAGSIFEMQQYDLMNQLVAAFIDIFMNYYHEFDKSSYYQSYVDHNFVLGNEIYINENNTLKKVKAIGIDKNFELIVEDQGESKILSSGEVHIKL